VVALIDHNDRQATATNLYPSASTKPLSNSNVTLPKFHIRILFYVFFYFFFKYTVAVIEVQYIIVLFQRRILWKKLPLEETWGISLETFP